ncbi:PD-(D/E)XK nuclease-like domain-containing protein [Weissella kandleri]|uniref:PD-(D/E)XK nuclease-like domain-containing protein n=1 Tax=Weissella kandleri TaxID=1616 RepID=UPI00387E55A7
MKDFKEVLEIAKQMGFNRMSPTRARKFQENPMRALYDTTDEFPWWTGDSKALDYGSIVHNLAEGIDVDKFPEKLKERIVSSRTGKPFAWTNEAMTVGKAVNSYFDKLLGDGSYTFEQELTLDKSDGVKYHGYADAILERSNGSVTVFDIKTMAGMEFDKWINRGYEPDSLSTYKKQIAFYAMVLGTQDAKLLFVKKSDKTPFIHEYALSKAELSEAQYDVMDEMENALKIINGEEAPKAINDGSQWAFKYFGGTI